MWGWLLFGCSLCTPATAQVSRTADQFKEQLHRDLEQIAVDTASTYADSAEAEVYNELYTPSPQQTVNNIGAFLDHTNIMAGFMDPLRLSKPKKRKQPTELQRQPPSEAHKIKHRQRKISEKNIEGLEVKSIRNSMKNAAVGQIKEKVKPPQGPQAPASTQASQPQVSDLESRSHKDTQHATMQRGGEVSEDAEVSDRSMEEFKHLRAALHDQLKSLQRTSEDSPRLRSQYEDMLKAHHAVLLDVKKVRNSKAKTASKELLAEMKALRTDMVSSLSAGASSTATLEKRGPHHASHS